MVAVGVRGSIIDMSSQAGRGGKPLVSQHCASKAAVISYTQSAALAMAPVGIRVNGILRESSIRRCAHVHAAFAKYQVLAIGEKKIAVGKASPLGRMGTSKNMAGAAVFLADEGSTHITAQTRNVDGGNCMS